MLAPNAIPPVLVDAEKYSFFVNDLVAAAWVLAKNDDCSNQSNVTSFFRLHKSFMQRLNRLDGGFFDKISDDVLQQIISGWIKLYVATLYDLRRRYPYSKDSIDLVANGTNWSQRLEISYDGLIRIDNASRYAEFWAERSVFSVSVFMSFGDRLNFIGSCEYVTYSSNVYLGKMLILDERNNGIPSFDFFNCFSHIDHLNESTLYKICEKKGWSIVANVDSCVQKMIIGL